jgi:hypothetical protein
MVLKMVEDRQVMYDGFSDKGAHSTKWFDAAKNFLNLAFAVDRREKKCSCNRCRNRRMLSEYEMSSRMKHEAPEEDDSEEDEGEEEEGTEQGEASSRSTTG